MKLEMNSPRGYAIDVMMASYVLTKSWSQGNLTTVNNSNDMLIGFIRDAISAGTEKEDIAGAILEGNRIHLENDEVAHTKLSEMWAGTVNKHPVNTKAGEKD